METRYLRRFSRYGLRADGQIVGVSGAVINGGVGKDGYRKFVLIDDDGKRRYIRRASLVCEAFHGPRPSGFVVRHLDGSKTNDTASNLRWSSQSENMADKLIHGTWQIGNRNGNTKLTREQVEYIRAHPEKTYRGLAAELGVTTGAIRGVRKGLTWRWLNDSPVLRQGRNNDLPG